MNKAAFSLMAGLLSLAGASTSQAQGASADIEKNISKLEDQWTLAEKTNKSEQIAPLLADKFMVTESEGKVLDRTKFLAVEKESNYSNSEMKNMKVIVFGDTAIARYALHQKYSLNGKVIDTEFQETDTWVKIPSGAWQCVAAHASKISQK